MTERRLIGFPYKAEDGEDHLVHVEPSVVNLIIERVNVAESLDADGNRIETTQLITCVYMHGSQQVIVSEAKREEVARILGVSLVQPPIEKYEPKIKILQEELAVIAAEQAEEKRNSAITQLQEKIELQHNLLLEARLQIEELQADAQATVDAIEDEEADALSGAASE